MNWRDPVAVTLAACLLLQVVAMVAGYVWLLARAP